MTILLQEKLLKLCITFAQLKETPRVRAGSKLKKGGGREGRQKNTELFFFFFPLSTHPFIDFSMLQLYKASTDSSNVALLIREGDPPRSLGVLQLGVCVDASVANSTVQAVHYHGQLHCKEGGWGRRTQLDQQNIHKNKFDAQTETAHRHKDGHRGLHKLMPV